MCSNYALKGTVSETSGDPPIHAKMKMPDFQCGGLKALSDQVWIRYPWFRLFRLFIFIHGFSAKVSCAFLAYKKQ